jgi:hypothetical protein
MRWRSIIIWTWPIAFDIWWHMFLRERSKIEFGGSKAAGIPGHQQRHGEDEHLEGLKERELVAVEITVWASIALRRRRSASATAGTLGLRIDIENETRKI